MVGSVSKELSSGSASQKDGDNFRRLFALYRLNGFRFLCDIGSVPSGGQAAGS